MLGRTFSPGLPSNTISTSIKNKYVKGILHSAPPSLPANPDLVSIFHAVKLLT
jgi:hypothetical protein